MRQATNAVGPVLSPLVEPCEALARDMIDGAIEGIVIKDRESPYRDSSHAKTPILRVDPPGPSPTGVHG